MIQQPQAQQVNPEATQNNQPKFKITGLENVDLREVPKIDLRQLERGQGYVLTVLGWIEFEGQYGPYYVVGVKDQNGNIFKFISNKQITNEINEGKLEIGKTYTFAMRLRPGDKYTLKSGEEREARGYSFDIIPQDPQENQVPNV